MITCNKNLGSLEKMFTAVSKVLPPNQKHFQWISITTTSFDEKDATLNNNSFADITFDHFVGYGVQKMSINSLGKTASTIKKFYTLNSKLQHSPPTYHIWKTLGTLINAEEMYLGLSFNDVPANSIVPVDRSESKLNILWLVFSNGIIRANAFENLNNLKKIQIQSNVKTIKKEAFQFSKKSASPLEIRFYASSLIGQSFQAGAFDGSQRPLVVYLDHININHLPEQAFKSILLNSQNQMSMIPSLRR